MRVGGLGAVVIIGLIGGLSVLGLRKDDGLSRKETSTASVAVKAETPPVLSGAKTPVAPDGASPEPPAPDMMPSPARSGANVDQIMTEDGQVVTKYTPKDRNGPVLIDAAESGQDPRTAAFPIDDMLEDSPYGRLPIVGPGGERAWKTYARPWSGARGTRVAIVLTGLGLSQTGTQNAIRTLPGEITLAFASAGNSLQRWMQDARRDGHEILLQVPMEPFDYPANDPGPQTLLSEAKAGRNIENLHWSLGRVTNYTGVMNYLGGRFLSDGKALEPVMRDITDRGLLFLDDGTAAQSQSGNYARAMETPHAFADLTLDSDLSVNAILRKLDQLENIARRKGSAIGVAAGFDESVEAIRQWSEEAAGRGIEIVGVSALASTGGSNETATGTPEGDQP